MSILTKHKSFSIVYLVIIIANLVFLQYLTEYKMVSKPMIMGSLLGFYIYTVRNQSPIFILAIIFAMLGDIFLMFGTDSFFIIGLSCFLIMQLLYVITFWKDKSSDKKKNLIVSLLVNAVGITVVTLLWDGLNEMKIPVAVYTAAISLMVIAALIRRPTIVWYIPVVIGVLFFMISDAAIAFSKFGTPFVGSDFFIILTYMVAQYLIVRGIVERETSK